MRHTVEEPSEIHLIVRPSGLNFINMNVMVGVAGIKPTVQRSQCIEKIVEDRLTNKF